MPRIKPLTPEEVETLHTEYEALADAWNAFTMPKNEMLTPEVKALAAEWNAFYQRISEAGLDVAGWRCEAFMNEAGNPQLAITYPGDATFLTEGVSMSVDLINFDSGFYMESPKKVERTYSVPSRDFAHVEDKTVFLDVSPVKKSFKSSWHSVKLEENLNTTVAAFNDHKNLLAALELYAYLAYFKKIADEHKDTMPTLQVFWLKLLAQARKAENSKRNSMLSPQQDRLARHQKLIDVLRVIKYAFDNLNANTIQAIEKLGGGDFIDYNTLFVKLLAELKLHCLKRANERGTDATPFIEAVYQAGSKVVKTNNSKLLVALTKDLDATINAIEQSGKQEAIDALLARSLEAQGRPHRGMQVLGAAMAVLGVGLMVMGALMLLTTLIPLPTAPLSFGLGLGAIGLGALIATGGFALFAKNRKKDVALGMDKLHQHLDQHLDSASHRFK